LNESSVGNFDDNSILIKQQAHDAVSPTPSNSSLLRQFGQLSPTSPKDTNQLKNHQDYMQNEYFELSEVKFDNSNLNFLKTLELNSNEIKNQSCKPNVPDSASQSKSIKTNQTNSNSNDNLQSPPNSTKQAASPKIEINYKKELDSIRKEFEKLVKDIQFNSGKQIRTTSVFNCYKTSDLYIHHRLKSERNTNRMCKRKTKNTTKIRETS
jgi:hypothetical protein